MKSDLLHLSHISECLEKIERYTADGKQSFCTDDKTQDAVLRNLHTLAESASLLSTTLTDQYPAVPWREIKAFRNVVVHDYLGLDLDQIWDIIETDLPPLKEQIALILSELG